MRDLVILAREQIVQGAQVVPAEIKGYAHCQHRAVISPGPLVAVARESFEPRQRKGDIAAATRKKFKRPYTQ